MNSFTNILSYALATIASICFVGGIAVLNGGRQVRIMDGLEHMIYMIDQLLDTKRKRHITGGILLSISALFGGLAATVMTLNTEKEENDYE